MVVPHAGSRLDGIWFFSDKRYAGSLAIELQGIPLSESTRERIETASDVRRYFLNKDGVLPSNLKGSLRIHLEFPAAQRCGLEQLTHVKKDATTDSEDVQALGQSYQNLREVQGHWDGGDWNPVVDNVNGEKHQTLQKLGEYFGQPGTPSANIFATVGDPEQITQNLAKTFLDEIIDFFIGGRLAAEDLASEEEFMIYIYHWRGHQDYLLFLVDNRNEEVIRSGWNYAHGHVDE
ncbi:hypothetical protein BGX24_004081 [Mortierella sp. AD032]|nr:hypothetical protein BGX24_004081 [Mortierella sp. AD032]